jgi:methyl-accepting chemotaxis protein
VLGDLDHVGRDDAVVVDEVSTMSSTITEIEIQLRELQLQHERHLDRLIDLVELLRWQMLKYGAAFERPLPEGRGLYGHMEELRPRFERHVGALATTQDPELAMTHTQEALSVSVALRKDILEMSRMMHDHVMAEQEAATARFRWLVMALGIVFLVMINVAVVVLLRMATMILKPIDQLVTASRELGKEHFDYRVAVDQRDEFAVLARAYNSLAEQLESNEQKRLEMLGQVALTLNHELNNASAIIKLQIKLLEKQSSGEPAFKQCLEQINRSLGRMTRTVEALKRVRRIVLTDYISGMKMLDLERSVEEETEAERPTTTD